MSKRTIRQILSGTSTVTNFGRPKTKPSAMPRPKSIAPKAPPKLMRGKTFGKGWGG